MLRIIEIHGSSHRRAFVPESFSGILVVFMHSSLVKPILTRRARTERTLILL